VEAVEVISATMGLKRSALSVMGPAVLLNLFAELAKALGYRDK